MDVVRRGSNDQGFSIIELMTVVLILAILVAVAVASYTVTAEGSRKVTCLSNQRTLSGAVSQYQVDHEGLLPGDLDEVQSLVQWRTGYARCVTTDAQFGYDNTTGRIWCDTAGHQTP